MGAADIIPGVSGGTIALITHIYTQLIHALTSLSHNGYAFIRTPSIQTFKEVFANKEFRFLLTLAAGIVTSLLIMSHVLEYLLAVIPNTVFSFFIGIIIAASAWLFVTISYTTKNAVLLIAGVLIGVAVSSLPILHAPTHPLVLIGAGAIAISAMLLPGVSGGYLLLVAGLYEQLLQAIQQPLAHISLIGFIGLGAIIGLLVFSHAIKYALARAYEQTLAVLIGIMLGALATLYQFIDLSTNTEPIGMLVTALLLGMGVITLLELMKYRLQKQQLVE